MTESGSSNSVVQASNYYFILKTENLQPLLEITYQLTEQIESNQTVIDKLCYIADNKIRYPETTINFEKFGLTLAEDGESDSKSTESGGKDDSIHEKDHEITKLMASINEEDEKERDQDEDVTQGEDDPIRYLLVQKYSLDKIELDSTPDLGVFASNARIAQLVEDNMKLTKIRQIKKYKNQELLKLIYDYERFIVEDILPSLRSELIKLTSTTTCTSADDKSLQDYVELKFELLGKMYQRYTMNVKYLSKLLSYSHALLRYSSDKEDLLYKLSHQFEALEFLQKNMSKLLK
ncbi:predicted protein [Scheffersomyces stipitis CBS 6054]|uniref:Uncharacterized protein n=1 Tax=Scheffersomyces stipitis (strain ATCC 58785 / CBS 6054 / NBRC 10063 / NRRL Y-11545) TaxID=322104 RepID=A3LXT4_PICST|nr:predicted protein [Scheffersomyces stipitis CBS 6054]ABN67520.2 predicted protein [Scheffersomyces stipitis CBS 6054]